MSKPPLWEVIEGCVEFMPVHGLLRRRLIALLIRSVRDWLVPEEPPPHRGMRPGGTNLTYQETLSVERQRLRALLTAEADRVERGEVEAP